MTSCAKHILVGPLKLADPCELQASTLLYNVILALVYNLHCIFKIAHVSIGIGALGRNRDSSFFDK